jgi:hypothetical protein
LLRAVLFQSFQVQELEEIRRSVGLMNVGVDGDKVAEIVRLRQTGESLSSIGRKLGMSRQSVREGLKKLARE